MKKGIIFSISIILLVFFMGCGVQNQLADTKWEREGTFELEGAVVSFKKIYEFKKDGTLLIQDDIDYPSELEEIGLEDTTVTTTSKWYCKGDRLYIEDENNSIVLFYDVTIVDDELILKQADTFMIFKRVN